MSLSFALLLLVTHGLPILFFAYMSTEVLVRNIKSVEHILLSIISFLYLLLFAEEYVRNQVPIEHSPLLSSVWLSSAGILIPGTCFHFMTKFTRLDRNLPKYMKYIYPYVFYLPVPFVIANIASGAGLISAQEFYEAGNWKLPVYNEGYYIAMTSSIVTDALYLIPLMIAKRRAELPEQRSIYNQLMLGVWVAIAWHCVFGYINYDGALPPYPYLYSGVIWCWFLRMTMRKHDFLNLYDKRFEKLFHMNPHAILLADRHLSVKHANPAAVRMLEPLPFAIDRLADWLDSGLVRDIRDRKTVVDREIELRYGDGNRLVMLVDVDSIWADNEPHTLLILQDITMQKTQQEEIEFLAYHDPLTRLPNRRYFHIRLDEALERAGRNGETLALLLIDIDKFKALNDTCGHLAGDEALHDLARILRDEQGASGVAARMGGDEFVMHVEGSPSAEEIGRLSARIQSRFAECVSRFGLPSVGLSIGSSFYPADGADGPALIQAADGKMYEMKRVRDER
jgi:diguanylate cyclase (GGDEF)-like protein